MTDEIIIVLLSVCILILCLLCYFAIPKVWNHDLLIRQNDYIDAKMLQRISRLEQVFYENKFNAVIPDFNNINNCDNRELVLKDQLLKR